jgi:hypothetical protein
MANSVGLLSSCATPKIADRDGQVGARTRLYIPFYGYWSPSGEVLDFPAAFIAQDNSRILSGTWKPNTYTKDGTCSLGK